METYNISIIDNSFGKSTLFKCVHMWNAFCDEREGFKVFMINKCKKCCAFFKANI